MSFHISAPRQAAPLPACIVWDWNGTLQDDVQAAVNGINVLLAERELPLVDVAQHRATFTFPVRKYYQALGFVLEEENWDSMARQFHHHFLSDSSAVLWPETRRTLEQFRQSGVEMMILSASERNILEDLLQRYGIRHYFQQVCGLDDLNARSKLEAGRELVNSLGLSPDQIWFVGDTVHDWEVASTVGSPCLLLEGGYHSRERLGACGCPVLPSIAAVPSFFGI